MSVIHSDTHFSLIHRNFSVLFTKETTDEDSIPTKLSHRAAFSLSLAYYCTFMEHVGISVVQSLVPLYIDNFNSSTLQIGILFAAYSMVSSLAALYMGRLSDKYGHRKIIILAMSGTFIGLILHGLAQNYYQFLACRFFIGAFGSSSTIVISYISEAISEEKRPKFISLLSASAVLAYIFGPFIAVGFSMLSLSAPFFFCAVFSFIGLVCAIFWLHDDYNTKSQKKSLKCLPNTVLKDNASDDESALLCVNENVLRMETDLHMEEDAKENSKNTAKIPTAIWMVCCIYFLTSMAFSVYTYVLYVIEKYDLNTAQIGIILLASSSTMIFNIIFSFNYLSTKYGVFVTCYVGIIIAAISSLITTLVNNIWIHFAFSVIGSNAGFGILLPAIIAMGVEFTNLKNRGKIIGYINISQSIATIIGPLFNAVTFDINIQYPFFISSAFLTIAAMVLFALIAKYLIKSKSGSQSIQY